MSLLSLLKTNKLKKPPTCTAVIAAAGISQRCEGEDKLFYRINDKPVLAYTVDVFQNCKLINEIIIVAHEGRIDSIAGMCAENDFSKVTKIMKGGSTRLESVINGVYAASGKSRLIAVHDGARPCIDSGIIERTILCAGMYNAAAPAVAIASTIKKIDDGIISETINREGLYEIQTPQVFRSELIKAALTNAQNKSIDVTDDCMAVEILGAHIRIVDGSRRNIKITDNNDLYIIEAFINEES